MEKEGKIRENPQTGEREFLSRKDGEWYPIKDADMAHAPKDAVTWWNEKGYEFGARSPEAREFMMNSKNYELELIAYNRRDGAILGQNTTYRPPLNPPKGP